MMMRSTGFCGSHAMAAFETASEPATASAPARLAAIIFLEWIIGSFSSSCVMSRYPGSWVRIRFG